MLRPLLLSLFFATAALAADAPNTLTAVEQAKGWRLLFDGQSSQGWVAIGKTEFPATGWVIQEGELRLTRVDGKTPHLDLVTQEKFTDFEFTFEWKITEGGNSGVKYNLPDPSKGVGCEYQLIDDTKHKDALVHDGARTTGGLYDVIPPLAHAAKPAGEWNSSRIQVREEHVEHFLNGKKTVDFEFGSEELKKGIATSKFAKTAGWGVKTTSPLLLQDHGDEVTFRNLKIRVIK